MSELSELRVAIVHYWLLNRRGGERVVEVLAEMFPQADLFTLLLNRDSLSPALQSRNITTSFLQRIPGATRHHTKLLPLYPLVLEQFCLDDYDLVISSESGPAKGVITSPKTCHICYCHTPMRYLWDMYHAYRRRSDLGPVSRLAFTLSAHYVRLWDLATASRVDYFVANSRYTASRLHKHYRREAQVIYPPAAVEAGFVSESVQDYYLVVSPLVDYKRIDLAIEACNRLGLPLRIIGEGEQFGRLRRLAGPTVEFLGYLPEETVRENYAQARALLYPGEEDFGIVPVEAQSFGRPVIAFGRGGVLESVNGFFAGESVAPESSSGVFFREQTVDSLIEAIKLFESVESRFSPELIRSRVLDFGAGRFKSQLAEFITGKVAEFNQSSRPGGRSGGV